MSSAAPACRKALTDATVRFPDRSRASDGIMGDAAHQRRRSDHNLGNAFDLTHDPTHGVDCNALSRLVITDERVTYVIWNRQIYNRARAAEGWRPYSGQNPHTHHMHVSIHAESRNDLAAWAWSPGTPPIPPTPATSAPVVHPPTQVLKKGMEVPNVRILQRRLNHFGARLATDGDFGDKTLAAVEAFQRNNRLKVDGIVGRNTWRALYKS